MGSTLSPYIDSEKNTPVDNDQQFWRYDVSQKRKRANFGADGGRLCFKFTSTGSCPREEKCSFRHDMDSREQYQRNVCFDFLNKGRCERGPDCKFIHRLAEEGDPVRPQG